MTRDQYFGSFLEVHSDATILTNAIGHLARIHPDCENTLEKFGNFVERKVTILKGILEDDVGTTRVDLDAPESRSLVGPFRKPMVGV